MASNITTVTVDLIGVNGTFKRVLDTFKFPVQGRHTSISEELQEAVQQVLEENGVEL